MQICAQQVRLLTIVLLSSLPLQRGMWTLYEFAVSRMKITNFWYACLESCLSP